jgi:hypothetical protein
MMQQRVGFAAAPDRHHQRIGDQLRGHHGAHRPADHAAGEEIDHHRHIQPALGSSDIGKISDPFAVWCCRHKLPVQNISGRNSTSLTFVGRQTSAPRTGAQSLGPHQPLTSVQPTSNALGQHIVPHAPGTIGAVAAQESGFDQSPNPFVASSTGTRRAACPGIKPAARDIERLAKQPHRPYSSMLCNEAELHIDSLAK